MALQINPLNNSPIVHYGLKKTLELFGKKSAPKDLTADSTSIADASGHSHKLPSASISDKGIVKLNSQTNSDSEKDAATPKAVKAAYDKGVEAKTLQIMQTKTLRVEYRKQVTQL